MKEKIVKVFFAKNAGILAVLFTAVLTFVACEMGNDPNNGLPLAGPIAVNITALDGSLFIQTSVIPPAQGVAPSYEVWYGDNPDTKTFWNEHEPQTGFSGLVEETITGLTNHTLYYVWVRAKYDGLGESDYTRGSGMPIPKPTDIASAELILTQGDTILQLVWPDVASAATYEVSYSRGNVSAGTPPTSGSNFATLKTVSEAYAILSGLTNGQEYTLWVRAVNSAGVSPAYAKITGTPVAGTTVPAAPAAIRISEGDKKLTLTWAPVPDASSYTLYYGTSSDPSAATEAGTVFTDLISVTDAITGLTNGVHYYVWVKSHNSAGYSSFSSRGSGTPFAQVKVGINFDNLQFILGQTTGNFIWEQNLPPSVFYPTGRNNTDRLTRVQETASGNLFTDAAAWYARTKLGEDIDFVFLNGGYIDSPIPKGSIKVGDFLTALVYPDNRTDKIMLLSLTGAQLKEFFDDVAYVDHTGRGGVLLETDFFGMVSKEVSYTIQYYKPPEGTDITAIGGSITSDEAKLYYHGRIKPAVPITINGTAIVDTKTYRICTTDKLATGMYFTTLADGTNKKAVDTLFWHAVAEYIYDQDQVTPTLDGRIKLEGGVPLPQPWVPGDWIKPAN